MSKTLIAAGKVKGLKIKDGGHYVLGCGRMVQVIEIGESGRVRVSWMDFREGWLSRWVDSDELASR